MDMFALAGRQNIFWFLQWCRRLSGELSARAFGAIKLLNILFGTKEICAVGVRMQQWQLKGDRASQDDNGDGAGRATRRSSSRHLLRCCR